MRLDNLPKSDNVEDKRGQGGGFNFPGGGGGRRMGIPMGGRGGGFSLSTIVMLAIAYFALKFIFGIDLISMFTGGGSPQFQIPSGNTDVQDPGNLGTGTGTQGATSDAGKNLVERVLGSNEQIWAGIFKTLGKPFEKPKLELFENVTQSGCGMAQATMGPFYCPRDSKIYIDLAFYQDMKTKLGAPGDFAQAYVIAHEFGHHVQNLLGIADAVTKARMQASEEEGNGLSVKMELQADCFAGIWTKEADAVSHFLEAGDIEEGLNAATQIGDDRLQKKSQGYVVPESFTHGSSAQRVGWFKRGLQAQDLNACDTFGAAQL